MNITIIGTGLIGGSLALVARRKGIATRIIGVEVNESHAREALRLQLVDEILPLNEAVTAADLIILAIPVHALEALLPAILNAVTTQVVMDMGSTKAGIAAAINGHLNRGRFVATHPMWGTENSGPQSARNDAFANKACVICNREQSDADALEMVEQLYRQLDMHLIYMDAAAHDVHVAYVSHISHITSFALANTVLEKEKEANTIFELASAGFESTVRLAKSNPFTWSSIFLANKDNVLDVLNEHIVQLQHFKECLENNDIATLEHLMENANTIKRILR